MNERWAHDEEGDDLVAPEFPVLSDEESVGTSTLDDAGHDAYFTVTNPPGTVTVSVLLDGRVSDVGLGPTVGALTETSLAEEIVVLAGLATQDARAAQYAYMLEGMNAQGHDTVATRDFLERDLQLPSPEQASAARAAVFAERYAGDHD